jgi:hypothetical protein
MDAQRLYPKGTWVQSLPTGATISVSQNWVSVAAPERFQADEVIVLGSCAARSKNKIENACKGNGLKPTYLLGCPPYGHKTKGYYIMHKTDKVPVTKDVRRIRERRRKTDLPEEMSIRFDRTLGTVFLSTEVGRVLRPLIIAEGGKPRLKKEYLEVIEQGSLSWQDLIPLASFFILRGRCRYCREKSPGNILW